MCKILNDYDLKKEKRCNLINCLQPITLLFSENYFLPLWCSNYDKNLKNLKSDETKDKYKNQNFFSPWITRQPEKGENVLI